MKNTKSDLWNLNQKLENKVSSLLNQCSTLEAMRQVESLTETNFENYLVRNYFRLCFLGGQIHMPVHSGIKAKVYTEGKYARQC